MKKLSSLSVFFPAFNEEKNIPHLLEEAFKTLPQFAKKLDVIVVNDGSTDRTAQAVEKFQQQYPNLVLVNHPMNLGYGAALKSGFNACKNDWIFFTDADLQFDLQELNTFLPFIDDYRVIIGYRTSRAEGTSRARNAHLFKIFVDGLFRVHVRDIDCAFKLFRADVIKRINLESNGAFISAELLYKLKKSRVKFMQLPVSHYQRRFGDPTGANLGVIIRAGWEAVRLYLLIKLNRLAHRKW